TVISSIGGPTVADEAFVDVYREDTGALVATVRGHAIANDNRSLRNAIAVGDHVHFFIPGRRLADEAAYRFDVRLRTGSHVAATTALSGITTRENAGLPVLFIDYNEGLINSLGDLFRFFDAVNHTTRMFPIKDSSGGLLRRGTSNAGAKGLRFDFLMNLPLATPGRQTQYTLDFVLDDLIQGTGNNAAGQNCAADVPSVLVPGRFFAYNFTYPEDLDGDGIFSPAELLLCTPPSGGGNSPMATRINNFGNKIWSDIAQQKTQTERNGWEFPTYGLQLVPSGPTRHHRGGWMGYAGPTAGWAAVTTGSVTPFPALTHELAHELGIGHSAGASLPGPAYDLERKRRVPNPFDVMVDRFRGSQTFFNSFFSDSDWNTLVGVIPPATGSSPPTTGSATRRLTGVVTPKGVATVLDVRPLVAPVELEDLQPDLTLVLYDADDNELALGVAEVSEMPALDWPEELPEPGDLPFRGEVEWAEEAASLAILTESGEELARIEISPNAPSVEVVHVDTESDPMVIEWQGEDPDGEQPIYDVVFVYPNGDEVAAVAGTTDTASEISADRVPGGEGVVLQVRATDGFREAVAEVGDLTLPNRVPSVAILAPVTGEAFAADGAVALVAVAEDLEDGALDDDSLVWSSDVDGLLGIGAELVVELSAGSHVLSAEATDSQGAQVTVSVTVTIE
ncbi:MAG: hypothetical protein AAF657_27880, partial [Acidobacteriota bacterium]